MRDPGSRGGSEQNPEPDLAALREELDELTRHLEQRFVELGSTWTLPLGRWSVRRQVSSGTIFWVYVAFLLISGAAGVVWIATGLMVEFGMALLVGSLFAGGAFVAQLWATAWQREHESHYLMFGEEIKLDVQDALRRWHEVRAKLEELEQRAADNKDH
jgi:hypothetical protein